MDKIISIFTDPANVAIIVAFLAALRAVGDLFEKIGEKHEGDDFFDSAGSVIGKSVAFIGRIINYFGIGNKQR